MILRHILIGSGNVRRFSNSMIWEVQHDPCMPFVIWKVLHWVSGQKRKGSMDSKEIQTYWHGKNEGADEVWVYAIRVHQAFNVDPRRLILRKKVGIYGDLGFGLVIDDGYNLNYITLEVVAYLGLPWSQNIFPYIMDGCKVIEWVKSLSNTTNTMRRFGVI